ncbi:MAG: hypothetical protein WAQ73_05800 [Bacillota bacterium]
MRRSIVVVLTLLLVAVLAVPAFGAELEVSGKYVGEIEYNRTLVKSINAGGETDGFDLLGMSTLYLTLDFAEGETVEGHLPLMFYIDGDGGFAVEPSDSFWVVYRGYPFRISLSNQDEGDYAFSSLGDPLGLGDYVEALDDEYVVLKAVGEPYDIDTVAYVIYTAGDVEIDEAKASYNIRYGLGRATYEFSDGYTLGLMAGVKHLYEREDEDSDPIRNILIRNIGLDISGPLGISEDSAFTAGLALSRIRGVDPVEWSKVSTAAALHLDDMAFGPITFNAAMHLVGEDFVAVAADDDEDAPSDVVAYAGKLNLYGEALTTVNAFDMDFDIQVYDEFEVKADTSREEDSFNEIGANVEFKPLEPLTIEVDGYYNKSLDPEDHKDDFDTQVYGKGTYVLGDLAEVWARGTWGYGGLYKDDGFYKGYGFRIDGGFNATPLEGVSVEGEAAYQFKDYDFKNGNGVPAPEANRLDASLYAVAEQSILPNSVEKVDFVVAALAKGEDITGESATKFVGYAHADITIDERFSDKIAVLAGTGDHYATAVHNKLTYTISANSTLGLGCLYREGKVGVDADYTVKIGESTLEIGYGKSGLASKACADADDKGKPWAWLCNSEAVQEPYLVTFKVTVPF